MDLHHEVTGDGPPVVLLHAGIADSRMWHPQWETFPPRHRTVRCDLPGFGRSPMPNETHSPAREVLGLLDRLDLERAALVAASMSGEIALEVALAAPDRVSALVLVDPMLPGELEPSPALQAVWEAEGAALDRGDVDAAVEAMVSAWLADEVAPAVRDLVGDMQRRAFELQLAAPDAEGESLVPDAGERLGDVRAPTLVVVGADDIGDFLLLADRAAREIPDARLQTIPGAAHLPSLERPAEFDAVVLPFLADADR